MQILTNHCMIVTNFHLLSCGMALIVMRSAFMSFYFGLISSAFVYIAMYLCFCSGHLQPVLSLVYCYFVSTCSVFEPYLVCLLIPSNLLRVSDIIVPPGFHPHLLSLFYDNTMIL